MNFIFSRSRRPWNAVEIIKHQRCAPFHSPFLSPSVHGGGRRDERRRTRWHVHAGTRESRVRTRPRTRSISSSVSLGDARATRYGIKLLCSSDISSLLIRGRKVRRYKAIFFIPRHRGIREALKPNGTFAERKKSIPRERSRSRNS